MKVKLSMDIVPRKYWPAEIYQVEKFFTYLEKRTGIVGCNAVMFVYNEVAPELSYILLEQIYETRN